MASTSIARRHLRWLAFVLASLAPVVFVTPLIAQDAPPPSQAPFAARRLPSASIVSSRVDEYVRPYLAMCAFSGTILIARHGHIVLSRGYGLADLDRRIPATPRTRYGIGSITKTMTAAAVELLAREGRLTLNDAVSKYLPGFAHGDSVTIVTLLAHSSGLKDYYSWPAYAAGRTAPISRDDFLAHVQAAPLEFAAGTRSAYSNSGYFVLAAIIERVSGMSYAEFVERRLFRPLGMTASGVLRDGNVVRDLAIGYDPGFPPSHLQPASPVSATWLEGSGSVYSTATDLYRWIEGIRSHFPVSVDSLPYPYGWGKRTRFGRNILEQNGRVPIGYTSYAGLYPDDDIVVVVLSNIQADVTEQMGTDLGAIALGQPYALPAVRPRPTTRADSTAFGVYAGRYQIAPGFVLTVRAVAQGLLLAGPDGAFLPLDQEGQDHFFFRPLFVPIIFERDTSGSIRGLDWNGQFKAQRLASP